MAKKTKIKPIVVDVSPEIALLIIKTGDTGYAYDNPKGYAEACARLAAWKAAQK